MAYLDVENLCGGYGGIQVLHGVSFSAERGAITAILGANGAGKTTMLHTVMGSNRAFSGRVVVEGVDITDWPTRQRISRAGLAMVPEGRQLFPELTVRENLIMGAYATNPASAELERLIEEVSTQLPVVGVKLRHKANSLSGGEQQMVAIARALMGRPKLLLADEVSQGISPILTLQLWTVLRKLADAGAAVVLVEQNVAAALKIANWAAVMKEGKVVQEGIAAAFASDETLRRAYLG